MSSGVPVRPQLVLLRSKRRRIMTEQPEGSKTLDPSVNGGGCASIGSMEVRRNSAPVMAGGTIGYGHVS